VPSYDCILKCRSCLCWRAGVGQSVLWTCCGLDCLGHDCWQWQGFLFSSECQHWFWDKCSLLFSRYCVWSPTADVWSWQLTSVYCQRYEWVELYICSSICLYGMDKDSCKINFPIMCLIIVGMNQPGSNKSCFGFCNSDWEP
jgi:hypothetical protein